MTSPHDVEVEGNPLLLTFANQTIVGHALVVVLGAVIWVGGYALWLDVVEGGLHLAVADSSGAIGARQHAMRVASIACWLWFGLAFVVGKGGPFLNTCIYPTVLLGIGPWILSLSVFGAVPGSTLTGTPLVSAYGPSGLSIFLPGLLVGCGVALGFTLLLYVTGRSAAWAEKHMPQEFHDVAAEVEATRED